MAKTPEASRQYTCPCNKAIGHMRDDPARLLGAATYLGGL